MAKQRKSYQGMEQTNSLPYAPHLDELSAAYEAVGQAMSAWQMVEEALYHLYERAIGPKRPGAAACGFHSLQFAGKLLVVDSAVGFALLAAPKQDRDELKLEWDSLIKKTRDKSMVRNHFAHFVTYTLFSNPNKRDVRLEPATFDFRYPAGLRKKKSYTINDIKVHSDQFLKFSRTLLEFLEKIPQLK